MNLFIWQAIYLIGAVVLLPVSPFLYLQGQYIRRKIGVLPDAAGSTTGTAGTGDTESSFLAIGESTVAGLGATTHETALTGHGVTAKKTLEELVPTIPPDEKYDYILLGTCGNDVLKVSSPLKFRRSTLKLIAHMQALYPGVHLFITNSPVIRLSPVLPQPIRFILGWLSRMHDVNIQEFTRGMDKVFYFHQPQEVGDDFFSDGIHPSEKGYADWSEAMIKFFTRHYKW